MKGDDYDTGYREEYIEERPRERVPSPVEKTGEPRTTATKETTHQVGVANSMAPARPVRVLRNAVGPSHDELMARLKLYSHGTVFLIGLSVGLILGVML